MKVDRGLHSRAAHSYPAYVQRLADVNETLWAKR